MPQPDFHSVFILPLEELKCGYMVTGAVAAIIYGEPRLTHDIDIVLHLNATQVPGFCSAFPLQDYYCPPEEVIRIELKRERNAHFNLIHHATGLKADCYLYTGDTLHMWALENRKRLKYLDSSIWVAPPEYVILRKLQYYQEGGSTKHLEDIRKILAESGAMIDISFIDGKLIDKEQQKVWRDIKGSSPENINP